MYYTTNEMKLQEVFEKKLKLSFIFEDWPEKAPILCDLNRKRGAPPKESAPGGDLAAARGEQQDDDEDPDPVVVVENIAQTVVHSEPPKV